MAVRWVPCGRLQVEAVLTDPTTVLGDLDLHAHELDDLSKDLAGVERKLVSVNDEYEAFMGAFEEGLWERHLEGEKFPPEALRTRMGHRAMDPELLGRYVALTSSRKRMEKRIGTLKAVVDAKRSILSALRAELEAMR